MRTNPPCPSGRAWRQLLSRSHFRKIRRDIPKQILNRRRWLLREWLKPVVVMPLTANSVTGAKYYLSSDPLDGLILSDFLQTYEPLFFPPEIEQLLPEDTLGLDLGAHHGAYAVTTLTRYPKLRLISVEPDPAGFEILAANIALNTLQDRCECVGAALTDTDGEFLLEESEEGSWGNIVVPARRERPTVRIRGMTLTTLLRGRKIDFLKSNCEGREYSLIPQMLARNSLPKVLILLLHPRNGEETRLLGLLHGAGYAIRPTCTSENHPRYVCVRK